MIIKMKSGLYRYDGLEFHNINCGYPDCDGECLK